jgi:hypothetical protein
VPEQAQHNIIRLPITGIRWQTEEVAVGRSKEAAQESLGPEIVQKPRESRI